MDASTEFDYEIASMLLELSIEANQPLDRIKSSSDEIELTQRFIQRDKNGFAFVFINSRKKEVYVSFRGVPSIRNLVKDVVAKKSLYPESQEGFFKSKVHGGTLDAYLSIKDDLLKYCQELNASQNYQKFYFTGHGFGAAVATLAAYDSARLHKFDTLMYNFGSIRTGNLTFSRKYNKLVPNSFRIVNNEDFCVRFPKLGYKHVGRLVFISLNKLRVDPSRFFQFLENLDNPIGIISGAAFFDHLPDKYKRVMANLEESKPGKLWKKKS